MDEKYKVKTESFEGPLDLLLNLIEKRKFFINDISLAQIADDYIEYIKNIPNFSMKDSSDFVVIASALMLIKSRSLLPTLNLTLEEENSIDDLEERLKILKRTRELSVYVDERFGKKIMFSKSGSKYIEPVFSPDKNINLQNMFLSIKDILNDLPKKNISPKKAIKKVISLEDMIDNLTKRIKENMRMSFSDFSNMGKADKINIVVSFLAMLELFKQGTIAVKQESNFGNIDMENKEVSIPRYN